MHEKYQAKNENYEHLHYTNVSSLLFISSVLDPNFPLNFVFSNTFCILDFRLSSGFEYCICSFGYFPGVSLRSADVSEPSVRSIFKGWM